MGVFTGKGSCSTEPKEMELLSIKKGSVVSTTVPKHIKYIDYESIDWKNKDVFECKDRIYSVVSKHPLKKFFVIDRRRHILEYVSNYQKEVEDPDTGVSGKVWTTGKNELLARFSIERIIEYQPLDKEMMPTYSMELTKKDGSRINIVNGNINDVVGQMKSYGGLIVKQRDATDVVNAMIAVAEETGNLIKKFEPPYPGFFWHEGEIISTVKIQYPEKREVREGLEMLHDFAAEYEEFKENLSFVLHWQIIAPFNFVKKQKQCSDQMGALYLYGTSRAGKSTIGALVQHIWGVTRNKCFIGTGGVGSVASFGRQLSQHTFPLVLDEAENIFDPQNRELASVFKNGVLYTFTRGRYSPQTGRFENIPALSAPIITSNSGTPKNAALGARMHSVEYFMDRPRTAGEQHVFSELFNPMSDFGPLSRLKALGSFAAEYMISHEGLVDIPWQESSEEIWSELYDYAGIDMPEWIAKCGKVKGFEEAFEAEQSEDANIVHDIILRSVDRYVATNAAKEIVVRTPEVKAEMAAKGSIEPWLSYVAPKTGKFAGKEFVDIGMGITHAIKKEYGIVRDLNVLGGQIGAEVTRVRRGKSRVWVARMTYNDYLEMFKSEDID
jgi:hypothetical protein